MKNDIDSEIRNAMLILSIGVEFGDVVVLLSSRMPAQLAHLVARAGQLFLKYQGA